MITKHKKSLVRNTLFRHLDGASIATTLIALKKNGIIDYIQNAKSFNTSILKDNFTFNIGYLNIALRLLSSQGLLIQDIISDGKNINYVVTDKGQYIFNNIEKYTFALEWYDILSNIDLKKSNMDKITYIYKILSMSKNNWGFGINLKIDSKEYYIVKQLNGIIITPLISYLGFNNIIQTLTKIDLNKKENMFISKLIGLLSIECWVNRNNDFNDDGQYIVKIVAAYGVTASYVNTFLKVEDLIFKDSKILQLNTNLKQEIHVDRTMNVWGSGGAHKTYFKFIDRIIIDIFNRPIEKQPIGIADMGCGNGEFIIHINNVIKDTIRGQNLEKFPIVFIGADYNQDALNSTKRNLDLNNISHCLIKADISKPSKYAKALKAKYNFDLDDFLNIRSFLDHNRIFEEPKQISKHISTSTCTFSSKGKWVPNHILEDNLIEHFKKWQPYIKKFVLITLELHSIDPKLAKDNLGKTLTTAYDATHGYSDQYIIEMDRYKYCIKKAGLLLDKDHRYKFPNNELATISINYIS